MKKSKIVTAVMLTGAMLLGLAACGKKQEAVSTEAAAPAETTAAVTEAAPAETTAAETQAETPAAAPAETEAAEAQASKDPVVLLHPVLRRDFETAQKQDNTFVYSAFCEYARLNAEEAKLYPLLDTALAEDLSWYSTSTMDDFLEEYLKEFPEMEKRNSVDPNPYQMTLSVVRADSDVCSFMTNAYSFMGGAHGSTRLQTFNYDTKTGQLADLSRIVRDEAKLKAVLEERLKKEYPEGDFFDLKKDLAKYQFDVSADPEHIQYQWNYRYDGIDFIFNEEELAPHASGSQSVLLKFADYPELLTDIYGARPEKYIMKTEAYGRYSFDGHQLEVSPRADENGTLTKLEISIDGTVSEDEIFAYECSAYAADNGDRNYLLVFLQGDDDEQLLNIYDITDGKAARLKSENAWLAVDNQAVEFAGRGGDYNYSARRIRGAALVDPDCLELDTPKGVFKGTLDTWLSR